MTNAACFNCLDEHQLRAVEAYLLCALNDPTLVIDDINLNPNQPLLQPHNLGSTPRRLRFVLKITSLSNGVTYSIGDEIDAETIQPLTSFVPPFTWGANVTNVWIASDGGFSAGNCAVIEKTGGASYMIADSTNCVGKLYIWK
jgi:hypothetical protein